MFSNFKDAFIRRPQFTVKTPDAVVEMISKGLPEGFRYVHDHDGYCRLECDGVMNIVPEKFGFPEITKPIFEKKGKVTIQDAMEYAYNSQTKIELLPDVDDCYIINGQKIKKSMLVTAPLKGVEFYHGQLFISPPKFPDPFPMKISGNGYSITLMVQRQPVNSFTSIVIASIGETPLSINYTIDSEKETINFNVKTHPSSDVSQVIAAKEILNAFIDGTATIEDLPFEYSFDGQNKKIPEETLRFWHKLFDVEKSINVKFDATEEIKIDDIKLIDALYRSLVEKKPYKKYLTDLKLSGVGSFDDLSVSAEKTPIGKEIMFEFTEEISVELLGASFSLFSIASIFNCVVSEIQLPQEGTSGDFFLKLNPAENKRMFSSTQYFLDPQIVEEIRSNEKHIDSFLYAEELEKY